MSRLLTPGTLTILILAILIGLAAAYGIRGALTAEPPARPQAPRTTIVPLASADLPAGRTIVSGDLVLMNMTQEQMEAQPWGNSLASVMLFSDQFIGRTLKKTVRTHQPFMLSDFYLEGEGPDLLSRLRPGYRAISVPVPFERGGYVALGATVDVLFRSTYRPGNDTAPTIPETTIVLVENAEVVAVESTTPAAQSSNARPTVRNLDLRRSNQRQQEQPRTVVLAVKYDQANKIEAVRNHGEFTLLTRPTEESSFGTSPPPTSLEDVLGLQAMLPEEPSLPAATEIYRGGQRQVNAFQLSGSRYVPAAPGTE